MNTININSNNNIKHNFKILYFGYNMHGKLTQHVFSKFVLKNDDYYKIGDIYQIRLINIDLSFCQLVAKKDYNFYDIDNFISYLDSGMPLKDYQEYLLTLLPPSFNLKNDLLTLCIFQKVILDELNTNINI